MQQTQVILKATNISKQYRLGLVGTGTLGDDLKRFWYKLRGKEDPFLKIGSVNDRSIKGDSDFVWALQDINFEVQRGEVLGIIGKNGAGKSTLLKILSRVTAPSTGEIKTRGRIASLLEVGTGFHPELTGRENMYLNGAILGMSKAEIAEKEAEIIAFSGCEAYMDTPVKRYSSGMRVRLAFAVAAFLEPDILVVDEVLAVGDAEFQKKAIGKMQDISKGEGRTVLFVSHNMAAVKSLCTRGIVLEHGKVVFDGGTDHAVSYYLNIGNAKGNQALRYFMEEDFKGRCFSIQSTGLKAVKKAYGDPISREDDLELTTLFTKITDDVLVLVYRFKNDEGNIIFVTNSKDAQINLDFEGKHRISMGLPNFFFNEGNFSIDIMVTNGREQLFFAPDIVQFTLLQESKELGEWMGKTRGALKPKFNWEIRDYES